MIKSKKQMYIIISVFTLILFLGGTTYAWFSYSKTSSNNVLIAGDIYLTYDDGNNTISFEKVFPETKEEARAKNNNYIVFDISGVNESNKTLYYEIDLDHGTDKNSPYIRFDDKDLRFDLVELDSQGNEVKYLLDNVGYSTLVNKRIWADSIEPSTSVEVSRKYKLRMWLDGDVIVSDTDTNKDYPATTFKNYYGNIKVTVIGDFTEKYLPGAYYYLKRNADTETLINFEQISSASNGEGLYRLPGTESDLYPIYYYRGNINNNNVIFGGFCWQMVRTTDTGGIKIVYNGVATGNGTTCTNSSHASRVLGNNITFNVNTESMSDVGYMSNQRYAYGTSNWTTGALFASDATWTGTNYELVDASVTTPDTTHHYTCNEANSEATCTSLRYVYYSSEIKYYITLTNGDLIEDALYKMTGNGTDSTKLKNSGYVLNQNDSTVKTAIESWFRTNLTNEIDSTKTDYRPYLEDTIFCNDRSFKNVEGNTSYSVFNTSGWNKSGGGITNYLYFGSVNRVRNDWYSTTNVPSTSCPNETDRFSVSSEVAHLNYPVGMLTADEIAMAGGTGANNSSYYLYTGDYSWTLSPYYFESEIAYEFRMNGNGRLGYGDVSYTRSVRPVISLKLGIEFMDNGDGSPTNPFVVKYN